MVVRKSSITFDQRPECGEEVNQAKIWSIVVAQWDKRRVADKEV